MVSDFLNGFPSLSLVAPHIDYSLKTRIQQDIAKSWILEAMELLEVESNKEHHVEYYFTRQMSPCTFVLTPTLVGRCLPGLFTRNPGLLYLSDDAPIGHENAAVFAKCIQFWVANENPEAGILYVDPAVWGAVVDRSGEGVPTLARRDLNIGVFYPGMVASQLKAMNFMVYIDPGTPDGVGHWVWLTYVKNVGLFCGDSMSLVPPPDDFILLVKERIPKLLKDMGVEASSLGSLPIHFVGGMPQQSDGVNCFLYALASCTYFSLVATSSGFDLTDVKTPKWKGANIVKWRKDFNGTVMFGPSVFTPPDFLLRKEGK